MQLTTDEQSKRGTIWSSRPWNTAVHTNWQVEFKFRVRGHGSDFFGDGFAFWFVEDPNHPGQVFGSKDMWNGIGVFFDTFDNGQREKQAYPFISVMYGDGTQSYENADHGLQTGVNTCHSGFRSQIGEPNHHKPTTARMQFKDGKLSIQYNLYSGEESNWVQCLEVSDIKLPVQAHFGFTASTGDLTDEHSIFSLKVETDLDHKDEDAPSDEEMDGINNIVGDTKIVKVLEQQAKAHAEKIEKLQRHLDDQADGLHTHLQSMLEQITQHEDELYQRASDLEQKTHQGFKQIMLGSLSASSGWMTPFFLFLLVIGLCTCFAVNRYNKLMKTHLL